jgi:hypothetical protein
MQNEQASRTALLIAASLVLLRCDPKHSGLVSKTSADLCAHLLEAYSSQTRLFLKIVRQGWHRHPRALSAYEWNYTSRGRWRWL